MTRKRCKKLLYAIATEYHLKNKKSILGSSIGKGYKIIKDMGFKSANSSRYSYSDFFELFSSWYS